jgi:hypothetical protein
VKDALETSAVYGLASVRSGRLLPSSFGDDADPRLRSLAEAIPDLFSSALTSSWQPLWSRLGSSANGPFFRELMFVSAGYVHVIQPLGSEDDVALLAVSPLTGSVGLVLSAVRAKVLELAREG